MASVSSSASSYSPILRLSSSRPKTPILIAPPLGRVAAAPKDICRLVWSARKQCAAVVVRRVALSSEEEVLVEEVKEEVEEEEEEAEAVITFPEGVKLYVGNLPFSVDSSQLAGVFSEAGTVEMVEVIYDKLTGKSRGFGFVTMSTAEEVEVAFNQLNGYVLEGRPLTVRMGPPPPRIGSPRFNVGANRVHVSNVFSTVDGSILGSVCSAEGNVVDARIIYDRVSGKSRGFGFVTYSSPDEVINAMSTLNVPEVMRIRCFDPIQDLHGQAIQVIVAQPRPRCQFDL